MNIYCAGHSTFAGQLYGAWFCVRCGKKVQVVW